ncbi:MAG: hypothetical protein BECKG1743E_GA0114224_102713 [Candidatus Kentron sp. G]|nr:MAG: hypothetical protein BECKG1743E_GA0114224_102713 [Candidatus Kentron sp. G]
MEKSAQKRNGNRIHKKNFVHEGRDLDPRGTRRNTKEHEGRKKNSKVAATLLFFFLPSCPSWIKISSFVVFRGPCLSPGAYQPPGEPPFGLPAADTAPSSFDSDEGAGLSDGLLNSFSRIFFSISWASSG